MLLQGLSALCIRDCPSFQGELSCSTPRALGMGRPGPGAPADVQAASPEEGFGNSWSHGVTNPKMRHLNSLLAALLKMPFKTVEGLLSP